VSPLNSVQQSSAAVPSYVTLTGSEQYAPAQVLYAVGHRSPHDASSSPGPTDSSPRAPSQLSPATGSPHWFTQSPSPPSPSRLGDVVASGELSPAHATALQQQFQQFSMASSRNARSSHHCLLSWCLVYLLSDNSSVDFWDCWTFYSQSTDYCKSFYLVLLFCLQFMFVFGLPRIILRVYSMFFDRRPHCVPVTFEHFHLMLTLCILLDSLSHFVATIHGYWQ